LQQDFLDTVPFDGNIAAENEQQSFQGMPGPVQHHTELISQRTRILPDADDKTLTSRRF